MKGKLQAYFNPRMAKLSKAAAFGVDARKIAHEIFVLEMQDPNIRKCDPKSLFLAAWELAKNGLVPNPANGGPYVVPRGNKASVDWGVAGYTILAMRTGKYAAIWSSVYREHDDFQIIKHEQPPFRHVEANMEPGEIQGVYAVLEMKNGRMLVDRMRKSELEAHRDQYAGGSTAWKTAFWSMGKKTVLKRLLKPLHSEHSDSLNEAIKQDIADDLDGSFLVETEE